MGGGNSWRAASTASAICPWRRRGGCGRLRVVLAPLAQGIDTCPRYTNLGGDVVAAEAVSITALTTLRANASSGGIR